MVSPRACPYRFQPSRTRTRAEWFGAENERERLVCDLPWVPTPAIFSRNFWSRQSRSVPLAGMFGIILGVGASHLLAWKFQWPTFVSVDSILIAFLFSAAVGVFSEFYPVRKAAQLDPIDALRYE